MRVCAGLWSCLEEEETALGNHSAQSLASVRVASPGLAMGQYKVKCSLCCVQHECWGLHWGLRQGCAGVLWGVRFSWFVEISRGRGSTHQPHRTEPCQGVGGQPWACCGALQGQMQPLLCEAGVVGPALGASAGLCRWFVGDAVLPVCGNFQRRSHYSATTAHRALPVCGWPHHPCHDDSYCEEHSLVLFL